MIPACLKTQEKFGVEKFGVDAMVTIVQQGGAHEGTSR
jgi:hypothetical protein